MSWTSTVILTKRYGSITGSGKYDLYVRDNGTIKFSYFAGESCTHNIALNTQTTDGIILGSF